MRGIYFPNANLLFDVQQQDPGAAPKNSGAPGATTTETFANIYGGWQAVENAAIALGDSVDLLMIPGRLCQNGRPVPVSAAPYVKAATDMREAAAAALAAARNKNQEKVIEVTDQVAQACANCHEPYRDAGDADSPARCNP
jgi:hypothetical protein